MSKRDQDRGFFLGLLWAARELNARGADSYAIDLVLGTNMPATLQRLAHREGYQFRRGFWAAVHRKAKRSTVRRKSGLAMPGETITV